MRVIAESLEKLADTFLHAGYISAYPRPYRGYDYGYQEPKIELDMVEALRLKGEVAASSSGFGDGTAAAVTAGSDWSTLLPALAGGAVVALLLYLHRQWLARRLFSLRRGLWMGLRRSPGAAALRASPRLLPGPAALVATVALSLALLRCGGTEEEPLPTEAPWQGVTVQQYENPELATKAILHGLVADALINIGREVSTLANLQHEVGLPRKDPTGGLAYALKTYGLDGWGREMRLTKEDGTYTVTSAGPDGQLDTSDDLKLAVAPCEDSSWDQRRHGHFVTHDGAEHVLLFHRWTGEHFVYNQADRAASLAGGQLFDLLASSELGSEGKTLLAAAYDKATAAAQGQHEPLVLQVF